MDVYLQLTLLAIAFVANLFSAIAGGGAGLLQFPALIFLGLPFHIALTTHKLATVALGAGATFRHWREGSLAPRFAVFICVCGLPGVLVGALTAVSIPEVLGRYALGVLTLGLGLFSVFKPDLGQSTTPRNRTGWGYAVGGAALAAIGVLNGALSSGTGLFVTLLLVRWFGLSYKSAVAYTLVLVGLFWNATGAAALMAMSPLQWSWVPALVLGSLLGGYAGAHLAIVRGNLLVKRCYEGLTIATGLSLIFLQ